MTLINDLNTLSLHREYLDTGYVIVRDLLREEIAEAAYECLRRMVPWEFHYRPLKSRGKVEIINPERYASMKDKEIQKLVPKIATLKDNDFSFAYCRYTIPSEFEETQEDARILTEIYRYFNSQEYLGILAEITGDDRGREVSTWASRYDRHHHLSIHMDESPGQGRIAAHVLGLSKDWSKEWGGAFAFCNSKGKPVQKVLPQFNTLVMFKVPRLHLVTPVKSYAVNSRYSLFGWYKTKQEYFA